MACGSEVSKVHTELANKEMNTNGLEARGGFRQPSTWLALMPVAVLLCAMALLIICGGAGAVQDYSPWLLLGTGIVAAATAMIVCRCLLRNLWTGLRKSGSQIIPSIPILLLIGTVSATWMLSGVVPVLIDCGLKVLNPSLFLFTACAICAVISVLTGSSWTTIATIGVALMGIGTVMGYSPGWVAGAIISGAYFGDKLSPLSDTTVLASSSCGVELFRHIRYMMLTSAPAMVLALGVFAVVGLVGDYGAVESRNELAAGLASTFNLTPWLMVVPAVTGLMIALRVNSYLTLSVSSLLGLGAMFLFQPQVVEALGGYGVATGLTVLATSTQIATGSELLDSLVATGGMEGMLQTVLLVTCAMVFGGVMIGSGMLRSITEALTKRIKTPRSTVAATVASGLALNGYTGDQYLSIILSSNMFRPMYERNALESRLLSRTVEDSVSVTSVLIPWNSCGLTQATVLGVATLTYLPYCVFNIVSPLMSLGMAWAGIRIRRTIPGHA